MIRFSRGETLKSDHRTSNFGELTVRNNAVAGVDHASVREFAAFNELGPRTRHVLNYALVPISAVGVYEEWRVRMRVDLITADRQIASDIKKRIKHATGIAFATADMSKAKRRNAEKCEGTSANGRCGRR